MLEVQERIKNEEKKTKHLTYISNAVEDMQARSQAKQEALKQELISAAYVNKLSQDMAEKEKEEKQKEKERQITRQHKLFQENVAFLEKRAADKQRKNAMELAYVKELDAKQAADAAKRDNDAKKIFDKAHSENPVFVISRVCHCIAIPYILMLFCYFTIYI